MAKFSGTIFVSTRIFTEQTFGREAVDKCLATLRPADAELLTQVTAVGWFPVEPIMQFHHALDRLYGCGDLALCEQVGHFSAGWALNTFLKMYVRLRSPLWIVDKSTSLWGRYHDTGRWVIDRSHEERELSGQLHDFAVRDPAFCARFRGWLRAAVELTGGRGVAVREAQCVNRGQPICEFVARWR